MYIALVRAHQRSYSSCCIHITLHYVHYLFALMYIKKISSKFPFFHTVVHTIITHWCMCFLLVSKSSNKCKKITNNDFVERKKLNHKNTSYIYLEYLYAWFSWRLFRIKVKNSTQMKGNRPTHQLHTQQQQQMERHYRKKINNCVWRYLYLVVTDALT